MAARIQGSHREILVPSATRHRWASSRGLRRGRPFPHIDANDPQIANKLIWNFNYKFYNGDDFDLRNFDADTGSITADRELAIERHFLIAHFRRLWHVNRLYVDPKPNLVPNTEEIAYKETLHPLIEPFDLKGVGFTYYRYLDPERQDDSWLYLPTLRRVRRLSTAQRSDALFGQEFDQDSYYGYSGQPAWTDWRFLGEKEMLAVWQAQNFPTQWAPPPADWAFDEVWEKRPVYVVEGVSKLPQYAYSKRVLMIDKELYGIPYADMYDRAGELWKVIIHSAKVGTKTIPTATKASYPYNMAFASAITMVDIQLGHATRVALPSHRFPGEEGWYYNFGDEMGTTAEQFSIAELIRAGN